MQPCSSASNGLYNLPKKKNLCNNELYLVLRIQSKDLSSELPLIDCPSVETETIEPDSTEQPLGAVTLF